MPAAVDSCSTHVSAPDHPTEKPLPAEAVACQGVVGLLERSRTFALAGLAQAVPDGRLAVRRPFGHEAVQGPLRGDTVWLGFDPEATHVF